MIVSHWINTHQKPKKTKRNKNKTRHEISHMSSHVSSAALYSVPSLIHFNWALLVARSRKMVFSSNKEYLPTISACLNTCPSIDLVRQSANMALLFTHRKRQFSCNLSRINRHSRVVRLSVHAGVDVFVDKSNTDLQSVATTARGASCKTWLGSDQSISTARRHGSSSAYQELTPGPLLLHSTCFERLEVSFWMTKQQDTPLSSHCSPNDHQLKR